MNFPYSAPQILKGWSEVRRWKNPVLNPSNQSSSKIPYPLKFVSPSLIALELRSRQTTACRPDLAGGLVLQMQFYRNTAMLTQLQNVYGCFGTAKVSSRNRDCRAARPKYLLFCPSQNKSVNPCVVTVHLHTSWSILYTLPFILKEPEICAE